uniref:Uncharacterized protein n=1 Tax=virus sp. ctL1g6 TaxID=2827988 RepID=A0A8S5RFF2_9VIRU|nr:MAG TPA: hypothetical protein [virus sp. ctL1g6]
MRLNMFIVIRILLILMVLVRCFCIGLILRSIVIIL